MINFLNFKRGNRMQKCRSFFEDIAVTEPVNATLVCRNLIDNKRILTYIIMYSCLDENFKKIYYKKFLRDFKNYFFYRHYTKK